MRHQDVCMRTTLTLDDDLAAALKERARTTGRSFKDVVNDVVRSGLAQGAGPFTSADRFRVEAKARGFRPGVDPRRLNQLVDELELGGFAAGLGRDLSREGDLASRVHEKGEPPKPGGGA